MIKRLYNYWLLPEIPEEAKKYKYQVTSDRKLTVFNKIAYTKTTLGYIMIPQDYASYSANEDDIEWSFSGSNTGVSGAGWFCYNPFQGLPDIWTSRDIPDQNGNTAFYASDRGFVEYGWWDGGEGDALSITEFTVPQGFHVTGTWKCIVSGTDSPVAKMEWYRNNVLISTETGKSESECRPSADTLGTFTYKCVITFENGKYVTASPMTVIVEAYDPGEDPGGGGDNPGGGGGGGGDETSLVTGIDLNVYPDTVVPGGRATIEVSVNGIGNYSKAFTARMSGHASSETELFSAGYSCNVWVAEEETAEYVLVTVTSVQDPNITATEMIYIDHTGTEDEGTTQEQLQKAFWKGFAAAKAYFQESKVSGTIHIAREVAEPTTKEGKLRRSFWQGFVSALIVTADTLMEGVLVSSDGYILKDSSGRYLCTKKQPVAYLYNGIKLPPLPEWDKAKYPYAVIMVEKPYKTCYATLHVFSSLNYFISENNGNWCIDTNVPHGERRFAKGASIEELQPFDEDFEYSNGSDGGIAVTRTNWANFYVRNEDGSVYLVASEPVPVYE